MEAKTTETEQEATNQKRGIVDRVTMIISLIVSITAAAAVISTSWSLGQIEKRTQCYKSASSINECTGPSLVERVVTKMITPESITRSEN